VRLINDFFPTSKETTRRWVSSPLYRVSFFGWRRRFDYLCISLSRPTMKLSRLPRQSNKDWLVEPSPYTCARTISLARFGLAKGSRELDRHVNCQRQLHDASTRLGRTAFARGVPNPSTPRGRSPTLGRPSSSCARCQGSNRFAHICWSSGMDQSRTRKPRVCTGWLPHVFGHLFRSRQHTVRSFLFCKNKPTSIHRRLYQPSPKRMAPRRPVHSTMM